MTEKPRASSSFIIATRNRPGELVPTVRSLVHQTVLPGDLCIVDSSDEATVREEIEQLCAQVNLPLRYIHPAAKGLTRQRNVGIDATRGDPVFFIDDDVVLDDDVHEQILAEYDRWGPELGGVRGVPRKPARPGPLTILWRRLFGMGGWWPEASGKMRAGFFVEGVSASAGVRRLDYFNGWFMSYRREVVNLERFDEALSGYAYKEDVDFSYRVRKRGYVLVQTPHAKIHHLKTETNRLPPHHLQRMNVANQFYLHRKNMPQDWRHKAALWWALVGLFTLYLGKAVQQRDPGLIDPAVDLRPEMGKFEAGPRIE
jgi:GT2 family glycosyltransferase